MKMRNLFVAAVMFLTLTAAAYAQATFSVGSVPVTTATVQDHTARTGAITFSQISGSSLAGTITIRYGGAAITAPALTTGAPAVVVGTGGYTGVSVNTTLSSNSAGLLVLNVPAEATSGTITVSGIRVSLVGTFLTTLISTISTTGNAIVAGQSSVVVINATASGLGAVTPGTAASVNTMGAVTGPTVTLVVNEGWNNAWTPASGDVPADANGVGIRLFVSAAPPAGVTITFPLTINTVRAGTTTPIDGVFTRATATTATATPGAFTAATTTLTISSASTAASAREVFYQMTSSGATSFSEIEALRIPITIAGGTTTFAPVSPISITVQLAPISSAFLTTGAVFTNPMPRFSMDAIAGGNIVEFTSATTTLLIPFATRIAASGFDTGISVANTTRDPGASIMGLTGAIAQSGTITFYIYPQLQTGAAAVPTVVTYTTRAGAPGTGLDASGSLPSGSTYTVMLSQLFAAVPVTDAWASTFNGYIVVVTNFTNAHGQYVLSDFRTFSQGALALVITGRTTLPEALNN